MTSFKHILTLAVVVLVAGIVFLRSSAQQTKLDSAAQEKDSRILPVVVVKAGETKELVMSVSCHLGITRGGGLSVKLMGDSAKSSKVWKKDGITVEVPDFDESVKGANATIYAPLKERNLNAFTIKVTTTSDARPGLLNFHLANDTCSGSCASDFRVLVVANK